MKNLKSLALELLEKYENSQKELMKIKCKVYLDFLEFEKEIIEIRKTINELKWIKI